MAHPLYVVSTSHKSRFIAFILCVPFGLFGAHYFYVGRFFRGCIALITGNFVGIGWFRDMFVILSGNFRDKYGAYLK